MVVKYEEIENFVNELGISRIKISKNEIEREIAKKWGCSAYLIKSRLDMMVKFDLLRCDDKVPGVFQVITREQKEKEADEKEKEMEIEKEADELEKKLLNKK